MVIALIANRQYKIRCRNRKIWFAIENTGDSPCWLGPFEYGEKITFVAQGDAYYYPWIELQNVVEGLGKMEQTFGEFWEKFDEKFPAI